MLHDDWLARDNKAERLGLHEVMHRPRLCTTRLCGYIVSYLFPSNLMRISPFKYFCILCLLSKPGIALRTNYHTLYSASFKVAICRVVCITDFSSSTIVSIGQEADKLSVSKHGISPSIIRKSGLGQVKILTCLAKTSLKKQQRLQLPQEAIYQLQDPTRAEQV